MRTRVIRLAGLLMFTSALAGSNMAAAQPVGGADDEADRPGLYAGFVAAEVIRGLSRYAQVDPDISQVGYSGSQHFLTLQGTHLSTGACVKYRHLFTSRPARDAARAFFDDRSPRRIWHESQDRIDAPYTCRGAMTATNNGVEVATVTTFDRVVWYAASYENKTVTFKSGSGAANTIVLTFTDQEDFALADTLITRATVPTNADGLTSDVRVDVDANYPMLVVRMKLPVGTLQTCN